MDTNSKEIIEYLEKKYQSQTVVEVKNLTDLNFSGHFQVLNQFIVGLTRKDHIGPGISHYEYRMKEQLKEMSNNVTCVPWPVYSDELDDVRTILSDLSEYLKVDIDAERMIANLKFSPHNRDLFYLVITVVQYPVVYAE